MEKDAAAGAASLTPWGRIMFFYDLYKADAATRTDVCDEDARFTLRVLNCLLKRDGAHRRQRGGAALAAATSETFCAWREALRSLGPLLAKSEGSEAAAAGATRDALLCDTAVKTLDALCLAQPPHQWKEALRLCTSLAPGEALLPAVSPGAISSLPSPRAPSAYSTMNYMLSQLDLRTVPLDVSTGMLNTLYRMEQHESTFLRTLNAERQKKRWRLLRTFCLALVSHPFMSLEAAKSIVRCLRFLEARLRAGASDGGEDPSIAEAFSEQYVLRLCAACQYEEALLAAVCLRCAPRSAHVGSLLKQAAACVAPSHIADVMRLLQEPLPAHHGDTVGVSGENADVRSDERAQQLAALLKLEQSQLNEALEQEFAQSLLAGQTQKAAALCRSCPSLLHHSALLQPPAPSVSATAGRRGRKQLHFHLVANLFSALANSPRTTTSPAFQWSALSVDQLAWVVGCYQEAVRTHFVATPAQQRHFRATVEAAFEATLALWGAVLRQRDEVEAAAVSAERLALLLSLSGCTMEHLLRCHVWDASSAFGAPWMRLYAAPAAPQLTALVALVETQLLPALRARVGRPTAAPQRHPDQTARWLRVAGLEREWRQLVVVVAAAHPGVALPLADLLSRLLQTEAAERTSRSSSTLFAPQEVGFLEQLQARWAEEGPSVGALMEKREPESVRRWRDAAYQRRDCPPLTLCLVMVESVRLIRGTSAKGARASPLTGMRLSTLIRFSESLVAMRSAYFFAEGARQFLWLLGREGAHPGAAVLLSFSWIEAARLFVAAAPRLLRRGAAAPLEEADRSPPVDEAPTRRWVSRFACDVYARWAAMHGESATQDVSVERPVSSAYEQAFCVELLQLLTYTRAVAEPRGSKALEAQNAQETKHPHSESECHVFLSLLRLYIEKTTRLSHDKRVSLYASLEAFLGRSYTYMARVAEAAVESGGARERSEGYEVTTVFSDECLQLVLAAWQTIEAAHHGAQPHVEPRPHYTNEGKAIIVKHQERIVHLLLQIRALPAVHGQDPCPSLRHALTVLRTAVSVHLSNDAKALLKLHSIHFHKANWKRMYADITKSSPRLIMREGVLPEAEEALERQRLSRALRTAPACDVAWALCQAKRDAGVRLTKEHYRHVLRRLGQDVAAAASPAELGGRPSDLTAAAARWPFVEVFFFALLRDGVTPDAALVEQIFGVLRHGGASDVADEKVSRAQSCLYFAKLLTVLPPITNARHAGRRSRAQQGEASRAAEQEAAGETEKGDYRITPSILDSVFESSRYVTDALIGGKRDKAEAEHALTTLQDTCELVASFITWANDFSRLPRITADVLDHLVFLFCNSFYVKQDESSGYAVAPLGASELLRTAFPVVKEGERVLFADQRATCTERRPPHAKALLLFATKQQQLHHVALSFASLSHLGSATAAGSEAPRHALQQLARLAKDPVHFGAPARAALALQVAEQALWGLPEGPASFSPAELRACAERAYVATLGLFTPDSSKLYNEMVMGAPATPEEVSGASPEGLAIERHIQSMMEDVAGELGLPAPAAAVRPSLPAPLLASVTTLDDLVARTEPTADFNMALRYVIKGLCASQSWDTAAAWVEAALPSAWPSPDTGHTSSSAPTYVALAAADHGPKHPAAVAARAVVDDFLLFDIHTSLQRASRREAERNARTSLQLLDVSEASNSHAQARLLHKMVKDTLFARAKGAKSVVSDAIFFDSAEAN
ncbi:hypothetical protein STCU_12113 [Strigomonas culicis]|uniref:Uncharacterized protein n=1 Tax=Strigomonas culicis TaxID=28005 RepID=S9TG50_9TRYP|nr:hypothetical protein STCU_12113 [Strigomonas culicis]|eukprot:EPY15328.1 hypothetical protein STCU_12113 [Strigomonas culicis]